MYPRPLPNTLLAELFGGRLPLAGLAKVLHDIMRACRTSNTRLRGLLPPETEVIDKTGTIGGITNDVGLIVLPQGRGEIVISVFIKRGAAPSEQRERVIAEIARTAYDFFLLVSQMCENSPCRHTLSRAAFRMDLVCHAGKRMRV